MFPSFNIEFIFFWVFRLLTAEFWVETLGIFGHWLIALAPSLRVAGVIVSFFVSVGVLYAMFRLQGIRRKEETELGTFPEGFARDSAVENPRWTHVQELIASDNPGDWRLAVMEADIMLDELLSSMRYGGESVGEKLKRIEPSDFTHLNEAWEAHKIRNRIAHGGSDFILTAREARRVIGLFEGVFREFRII